MKASQLLTRIVILTSIFNTLYVTSKVITAKKNKGFGLEFDLSMMASPMYKPSEFENNLHMQLYKSLYNNYIIKDFRLAENPKIPKIIHQIWIGTKPYPEQYKTWGKTFIDKHNAVIIQTINDINPNADYWQYVLWTNELVNNLKLTNQLFFDSAKQIATKTDMLRYEILNKFGGIYVDTDVECLQSLDIFNHCCDFFACLEHWGADTIGNAVIGSQAGHPITKLLVEQIKDADPSIVGLDVIFNTGPFYFTQCILQALESCDNYRPIIFPSTYFYPYTSAERRLETYLIHYWHGNWSKEYV